MAIEIIPLHEQARANGFMWGGKTVGIAIATAGGAWMMDAYGLKTAFLAHAALIGLVMLVPIVARERPGERILPGPPVRPRKRRGTCNWRDGTTSGGACFACSSCQPVWSVLPPSLCTTCSGAC